MNDQNLDHIDDEELLSLFYATEKLLQSNNNIADPSALRKIESIKKKAFHIGTGNEIEKSLGK